MARAPRCWHRICVFTKGLRCRIKRELTASRGPKGGSRGEEGLSPSTLHRSRGPRVISASTFGFALALVVVVFVAVVLIIWLRLTAELGSLRSTSVSSSTSCEKKLETLRVTVSELKREAPATLAAEVAALHEAVNRLRHVQQRFQGRFDQYVRQGREEHLPRLNGPDGALDPELAAELALQNAPPVAPGKGS